MHVRSKRNQKDLRDTDITLITPATHMTKLLISCLKGQLLEFKTSENYTCFLPNEIMSIHWTEKKATVFSVVLVKVNGVVREDHSLLGKTILFLLARVEACHSICRNCNSDIHKHYADKEIEIELDNEFNDGCASQFKCAPAFSNLASCFFKSFSSLKSSWPVHF